MQWILQHSTGGKNLFGIVMVLLLTLTIAFARDLTPVVTTMPSKGGLVLLTRAILHNPARHYLPLRMPLSQGKIMITLFTHSGVMIRQTVVQPEAYADRIALKEILGTQAARIAAGYYLYRIEPLKDKIHAPTRLLSDSLRFEEVSTTHLQYDSTYAGFTDFSDLTGEGHPDILLGVSTIFRQPRLFVNDGSGRFQDETGIRLPQFSLAVADLVTFDADRDGDRDIYLAAQDSLGMFYQRGRLLLNDGSGLFTDVTLTHLPDLPTMPINVDAGYINADTFPDLLITGLRSLFNPTITPLYVLINDGNSHFLDSSAVYLPQTSYGAFDAILVDVNSDSLNDIALGNMETVITDPNGDPIDTLSGQNALLVGQPETGFVDETAARMPFDNDFTKLMKAADINNDQAPELYAINVGVFFNNPVHTLYLNDGGGLFNDVTGSHFPSSILTFLNDAEFRDFNRDGSLDLYLVNVMLGQPAQDFLLQGNNGFFSDASAGLPNRIGFDVSVAAADMDGDQDDDLFNSQGTGSLGRMSDRLYRNLHMPVGIGDALSAAPQTFFLEQNSPNPFNPQTTIRYQLPTASDVQLTIYNLRGQMVRMLVNQTQPSGWYRVTWNGKNDSGFQVASGVYFCRLTTENGFIATRKMMLLR